MVDCGVRYVVIGTEVTRLAPKPHRLGVALMVQHDLL